MRSRGLIAISRRSVGLLVTTAVLAAPLNASAWVSVDNKAISLPANTAATSVDAARPVRIAVSLKLRNAAQLHSFLTEVNRPGSPAYEQFLATGQFGALYGATASDAQAVADYLAASSFANVSVNASRTLITATGTTGALQKAFNTTLTGFTAGGKARYANVTDVQVPDSLKDIVESVAGATNIEAMHLHTRRLPQQDDLPLLPRTAVTAAKVSPQAGAATDHPAGYTGPEFATAYGGSGIVSGHGTTVAIVTEGDDLSTVINDLRIAELVNNQPVVPVEVVQIGTLPSPQDHSGDDEWDLDSQASTGIAENVKKLIFYNTVTLNDADLIPAVQKFADENRAQIGNQSYGGCEAFEVAPLGDVAGFEAAFMQAVAQGQTWFASTGDIGSGCNAPEEPNLGYPTGVPNAEYPSSSPNIVAAGGTTLTTDADYNYISEVSWIGGGGGISYIFAPPQWQIDSGAVPSAQVAGTGVDAMTGVPASETGSGRGTPDVAMAGDTPLSTVVGGARETVAGTSLSSPLSAGAYARIQTANCNKLGYGAPLFYKLDTAGGPLSTAAGFNDVTSGENGTYVATTGWDYNTGFGSFDITAVNAALKGPGCAADKAPIAALAADHLSGTAPLTVNFSGAGAKDPDNDGLPYYILNFGDGSVPLIQDNPTFPAHVYAGPGKYTAIATVRDGVGNVSAPVSLDLTVSGTPLGCTLPGQLMITSPAGVNPGTQGMDIASGTDDLRAVYFAEPANLKDQLVITMQVDNLTTPMSSFRWVTYFIVPNDPNDYYVAMVTDASGAVSYEYGVHSATSTPAASLGTFQVLGALDASSTYKADGTITLVLNKSALKIVTSQTLSGIVASVRTDSPNDPTGTQAAGVGLTQDTGSAVLGYAIAGNDVCAAALANPVTTPVAGRGGSVVGAGGTDLFTVSATTHSLEVAPHGSTGGALGLATLPLLGLVALRRRRRR